ncbi:MAG TPA: hypothetical protein VKU19_28450 [Bryobacteraceae bacterium]|nr:hypothetical protein [Bryobacteraceae bacterium]
MKIWILSFLIATAALIATVAIAADNPSINGKWQVTSSISGNEYQATCTFTQKAEALTGSCTNDQGTVEITGSVTGDKVAWSYKSQYNGTPLTVKYEGTVNADSLIKGSVNVPEFGAGGDFSASPSK